MKGIRTKGDRLLLVLCVLAFGVYALVFGSAFAELPLAIPPWHLALLLYFPFVPMFLLELLLCRTAKLRWRLLVPLIPLVLVGLWFLSMAEWYLMAWILYLWWCVPSVLGCLVAWGVWAVRKRIK